MRVDLLLSLPPCPPAGYRGPGERRKTQPAGGWYARVWYLGGTGGTYVTLVHGSMSRLHMLLNYVTLRGRFRLGKKFTNTRVGRDVKFIHCGCTSIPAPAVRRARPTPCLGSTPNRPCPVPVASSPLAPLLRHHGNQLSLSINDTTRMCLCHASTSYLS